MTRRIFVFDDPDRFVAGTIGPPGQRVFFLQAVEGRRVTSVSLEKVQVALLADRVAAIVAELQHRGIPGVADLTPDTVIGDDEQPLHEPLRDAFRAGTLTISWDGEESEVTIEARSQEADEDDDEDEEGLAAEASEDADDDVDEDERTRWSVVYEYSPIQFLQLRGGARFHDGISQNALQNREEYFLEVHGFF